MTPEQFGIGVMCDIITFVPVFILVLLFKTSRRRVQRSNRVNGAIEKQELEWTRKSMNDTQNSGKWNISFFDCPFRPNKIVFYYPRLSCYLLL